MSLWENDSLGVKETLFFYNFLSFFLSSASVSCQMWAVVHEQPAACFATTNVLLGELKEQWYEFCSDTCSSRQD